MLSTWTWRKRALMVGLVTGLLLPILYGSMPARAAAAETAGALPNFRLLQPLDPRLQLMQTLVLVAYQDRYGSKTAVEFPPGIPIILLLGTDGTLYSRGCECYGVTHWSEGVKDLRIVVVEKTGQWQRDEVLAHELTHVLQVAEGRWSEDKRQQFELEAEVIAAVVMTQWRMLYVPALLGDVDAQ